MRALSVPGLLITFPTRASTTGAFSFDETVTFLYRSPIFTTTKSGRGVATLRSSLDAALAFANETFRPLRGAVDGAPCVLLILSSSWAGPGGIWVGGPFHYFSSIASR